MRRCSRALRTRPRSKTNAEPTIYRGHKYASKLEVAYAKHLDILVAVGEVARWLPHQPRLRLLCNGIYIGYYTPDFQIWGRDGSEWLVDTKGYVDRGWPFRLKVIRACYPTLDLRIVTKKDF